VRVSAISNAGTRVSGADKDADWLTIEHECRTTQQTIRAIAAKHGVSYHNLRARSLNNGWRRKLLTNEGNGHDLRIGGQIASARDSTDLVGTATRDSTSEGEAGTAENGQNSTSGPDEPNARVMPDPSNAAAIPLHRALVAYVNTRHAPGSEAAYSEKAILEGAALQIEMIRQHRGDIRGARELALALMAQLQTVSGNRELFESVIHEFAPDPTKRAAMLRAVSLPTHIAAMRDLSTTLRQLIPLERQALGILDHHPLEPNEPMDPTDKVNQRLELSELEAAIDRTLDRAAPRAERVG